MWRHGRQDQAFAFYTPPTRLVQSRVLHNLADVIACLVLLFLSCVCFHLPRHYLKFTQLSLLLKVDLCILSPRRSYLNHLNPLTSGRFTLTDYSRVIFIFEFLGAFLYWYRVVYNNHVVILAEKSSQSLQVKLRSTVVGWPCVKCVLALLGDSNWTGVISERLSSNTEREIGGSISSFG